MAELNGYRSLEDLPYVVLSHLSHYLNIGDVRNLSETCHSLRMQIIPTLLTHRKRSFQRSRRLRWYEEQPMTGGNRFGHAMCFHRPQNRIYIFGGANQNKALFNDLRFFCLKTRRWSLEIYENPVQDGPEAASLATLVSYKNSLILFGVFLKDDASSLRIFVLDLILKRWNTVYQIKPTTVAGNTAGHAAVVLGNKVIFFGGLTRIGEPTNRILVFYPDTMVTTIVDLINPPTRRVMPALCVLDSHSLLLLGGRSSIKRPSEKYEDAFEIRFDGSFQTAECRQLEIENPELYPHTVYSHTATDDGRLVIVARPASCSKISIDSVHLRQLYACGIATERFFDVKGEKLPLFLCLYRTKPSESEIPDHLLYPKPSNTHQFAPATTSFEHTAVLRFASYIENDSNFLSLLNQAWEDSVRTVERLRDFTMFSHDFFICLYWLCSEHAASSCNNGTQGSLMCFKAGGCIEVRLRQLYPKEEDEFILALLKTMCQFYCLSQGRFPTNSPYLPIQEDMDFEVKPIVEDEYPLERLLELQTLVPVHRAIIDAPLTSVFYTVDLHHVRESRRVRFTQQPVPFNAPLFQQYAPVVAANYEFFTCGGVDPLMREFGFNTERHLTVSNQTFTGY